MLVWALIRRFRPSEREEGFVCGFGGNKAFIFIMIFVFLGEPMISKHFILKLLFTKTKIPGAE